MAPMLCFHYKEYYCYRYLQIVIISHKNMHKHIYDDKGSLLFFYAYQAYFNEPFVDTSM